MSGLWTYRRRPSCMVRYRHGGYSAIYPLAAGEIFNVFEDEQRPEQAEIAALDAQGGEYVLDRTPPASLPHESNILSFPSPSTRRKAHKPSGRAGGRAVTPPKKTRD